MTEPTVTFHWLSFLVGAPVWGSVAIVVFGAILRAESTRGPSPNELTRTIPAPARSLGLVVPDRDTARIVSLCDYRFARDVAGPSDVERSGIR